MFFSKKIKVNESAEGKSLVAIDNILKDESLIEFERYFTKNPSITSMQVKEGIFQECPDPNAPENFLNHSCEPNGYIDFITLTYKALRNIARGEELTYNYLTTEWELKTNFLCKCHAKKCYGLISGFKYLTLEQKKELEPFLFPFLKKKLKEEIESLSH